MIMKPHLGGFFGLLAVMEQAGFLFLSLIISQVFQAGLESGGGAWLGLPFHFSGVLFTMI